MDIRNATTVPASALQEITNILFDHPLLSLPQLALAQELARLYATPLPVIVISLCPPMQPRKLAGASVSAFFPLTTDGFESRYLWYRDHSEKQHWFGEHWPKDGEQTLIIVPEKWHLREWEEIVGTHMTLSSDLSPKEYFERYFAIRNGKVSVVLGTKSALFAPFHNLRHVIVDFEHSPHHKNWDQAPRYHARDAAMRLAELWQCPVTVMSHTPSVESAARLGRHPFIRSHTETRHTKIRIVDLKEEYQKKNFSIWSDAAEAAMARAIAARTDILVMVHRRGAYPTVACKDCGRVERCPNCSLPLIYHEQDRQLHCHPCRIAQPLRPVCAFCHGPRVAFHGVGTQAVEDALRERLRDTPYTVHRADTDTTIPHFEMERPAALVGTSRALAHVRAGRVGFVFFNDIDGFLSLPEYRATTEFVGLVRDIAYHIPPRAEMILQTREPLRPVLQALAHDALGPWYREELSIRQQLHYPPFWSILKLTYWGTSVEATRRAVETMHAQLNQLTGNAKNATLTPSYATHPAIRKGLHGMVVLLRMPKEQAGERFPLLLEHLALPDAWKVDVDPLQLLV